MEMTSSDLPNSCPHELPSQRENNNTGSQSSTTNTTRRFAGIFCAFIASLSFSLSLLFVKLLNSRGMDTFSTCVYRQIGIAIPAIPLVIYYACHPQENTKKTSMFDPIWPLTNLKKAATVTGIMVRSLVGTTAFVFRFYALKFLSVGDTSAITSSSPALVTFFAHCCLGESCQLVPLLIAFLTLGGVAFVTKPPLLTGRGSWDSNTATGTSLAVGSLLCSALQVVLTRQMRKIHFSLVVFAAGWVGLIQALGLSLTFGSLRLPQNLKETLLAISLAAVSFVGQTSMTLSLKFEKAGPVALVRSCDIVLGFLLQFFFLGEQPDIYSVIGVGIIMSCVTATAFRIWLSSMPKESKAKLTCLCFKNTQET